VISAPCPRCDNVRDRREGAYFVCVDCHWRWTVSLTGMVYLQSAWSQPPAPERRDEMPRRLLGSVDGLSEKLAEPWPARPAGDEAAFGQAGLTSQDIARLKRARDATDAGYFNEGVPLSTLREEGIFLPPPSDGDHD
jgi:hypothetical protein